MQTLSRPITTTCRFETRLYLHAEGRLSLAVDQPVESLRLEGFHGQLLDSEQARLRFRQAQEENRPVVLVEKPRQGGLAICWANLSQNDVCLAHRLEGSEEQDLREWEDRFRAGQLNALEPALVTALEFGLLGRFTAWLATVPEEPGVETPQDRKALVRRIIQAVEETFKMDPERKSALAQQVARQLLPEPGADFEALFTEEGGRPRCGPVRPRPEPNCQQPLQDIRDRLLLACEEQRRELLVRAEVWLERLADIPRLAVKAASLAFLCQQQSQQAHPQLHPLLDRLDLFLETVSFDTVI